MSALQELRATMARLRAPDGCPWDREQDHRTLSRYLIEECAELLDAIDRMDIPHMREELGDVLLQVVFHAQMAEEAGHFDLEQVAAEINESGRCGRAASRASPRASPRDASSSRMVRKHALGVRHHDRRAAVAVVRP
jgi:NTP pyrophosphatase (non-canonical NTP hydrolase)